MTGLRDMVCGHTKYEGCPPCPCERAVLDAWFAGQLIERATIDYEYILDWAVDVGGLNYRPDMEEIKDVVVAAVGEETDDEV